MSNITTTYQHFIDWYTNQNPKNKPPFLELLNNINTAHHGECFQIIGPAQSGKTVLQFLFKHPILTIPYYQLNELGLMRYNLTTQQPHPQAACITEFVNQNQHNDFTKTTATLWITDFNLHQPQINPLLNQLMQYLTNSIPHLNFVVDGTETQPFNDQPKITQHYTIPYNHHVKPFNNPAQIFTQPAFQKLIFTPTPPF